MDALYDRIGIDYSALRRPEPAIDAAIRAALGDARQVLNVGAGAGSYEPLDREVIALEPSATMIAQRPTGAAPVIRGEAGALPLADRAVDATLAILTLHHWPDQPRGLQEMRRVARQRVVLLTWDPAFDAFWLYDYFPEILAIDQRIFPSLDQIATLLGSSRVIPLPIPHNCCDGFLGAYWNRPAAYLDARVRAAISTFAAIADAEAGLTRLAADLSSGAWEQQYAATLPNDALNLGYRLIVAER